MGPKSEESKLRVAVRVRCFLKRLVQSSVFFELGLGMFAFTIDVQSPLFTHCFQLFFNLWLA